LDGEITVLTINEYLSELIEKNIDTIILGCTHYPLLEKTIQKIVGPNVKLIDSGRETARVVNDVLTHLNLKNFGEKSARDRFYVSDIPLKFREVGSRFLGKELGDAERIDFDEFLIKMGSIL
jgi:glutamate racemase